MDLTSYREEIKLKLTGGVLDLELDDSIIDRIINSVLREIQRYISITKVVTTPFEKCIDLSKIKDNKKNIKVSTVTTVFRSDGFVSDSSGNGTTAIDPMQASQWQLLSGLGNINNLQNYTYNYMAWNTLLQLRNTTSTDLAFYYDKSTNKLYINVSSNTPNNITIEYIPRYDSVEEITSDYWIDIILNMSLAMCKVTLGRIRSKYKQSNSLWTLDGDTMLQEGTAELNSIREALQKDHNLLYPID